MEGLGGHLLYLYGFVRPSMAVPRIEGVEEGSDIFLIESADARIAPADVACAASLVPAEAYERAPGERPAEQLEWVTPRALRHHAVVGALHAAGTVLPLQFGAVCRTADDVRQLIADLQPVLSDLLDKLHNKDEWTLRATADDAVITARCEAAPQVMALKAVESGLTDGRAYFARKQRAKVLADLVAGTIASAQEDAYARLAPLAADVRQTSRHSALLVDRTAFDDVASRLAELQAVQAGLGLTFELVGPWPPYSFAPALRSQLGRE